jgi:hypothetical protein
MVHHSFDDLPYLLEEADAPIVPAAFENKDSDNPPELEGYPTFVPDNLDMPS